MFCPNCGNPNDDNSYHCIKCGGALREGQAPPPPRPAYGPPPVPAPGYPQGYGSAPPPIQQNIVITQNAGGQAVQFAAVPNHMVKAVIATLCCCLPLGIVSIIFAAQVNSKLAAGDVAGARAASSNANLWAWIAIGLGLTGWAVWALIQILAIAAGAAR